MVVIVGLFWECHDTPVPRQSCCCHLEEEAGSVAPDEDWGSAFHLALALFVFASFGILAYLFMQHICCATRIGLQHAFGHFAKAVILAPLSAFETNFQ